jgi:hypothetical protein
MPSWLIYGKILFLAVFSLLFKYLALYIFCPTGSVFEQTTKSKGGINDTAYIITNI